MRIAVLSLLVLAWLSASAQTGPGGVGNNTNNVLWLSADNGVNLAGASVISWNDRSGSINNATSPALAARPTLINTALNGYPIITFDGANDQLRVPDAGALDLQQWDIFMVSSENVPKNNNAWFSKGTNTQPNYALWSQASGALQMPIYDWLGILSSPTTVAGATGAPFNLIEYNNTVIFGLFPSRTIYKNAAQIYNDVNLLQLPATNNNPIYIGNVQGTTTWFLDGSMAEMIVYNAPVNSAQRIIISNYLSAKYGSTLTTTDIYSQDLPVNGNYDHDVAGIGRVSASSLHVDSRGTGIVRINGASGLGNNEFLIWGHDNGILGAWGSTDFPAGLQGRWHRIWRGNEVSQTGTAVDVGNVNITFDLTGQGPVVASQLRLLVDANNNGIFADDPPIAGATAVGGNDYRFTAVSALVNGRRFTLGTTNIGSTPLPIELIEFTAEADNDGSVRLGWRTASERNNDHFTIQRSANGTVWENVMVVRGAGNSNVPIDYHERDAWPLPHLSYYRLMQTDQDGTSTWSRTIAVTIERTDDGLLVFPDPAQDEVHVVFGPELGKARMQLFNELGQPFAVPMTQFEGRIVLSAASLPAGMYLVVVIGEHNVLKKRLIVSR